MCNDESGGLAVSHNQHTRREGGRYTALDLRNFRNTSDRALSGETVGAPRRQRFVVTRSRFRSFRLSGMVVGRRGGQSLS